jgi:hypothetical protein
MSTPRAFHENGCWKIRCPKSPAKKSAFGRLAPSAAKNRRCATVKGVRHALIADGESPVDETDALYMLGACAAFVSYLINKARLAGLIAGKK